MKTKAPPKRRPWSPKKNARRAELISRDIAKEATPAELRELDKLTAEMRACFERREERATKQLETRVKKLGVDVKPMRQTPTILAESAMRALVHSGPRTMRDKHAAVVDAIFDLARAVRYLDERCEGLARRPAGERRCGPRR